MTPDTLRELADRCEEATGPSKALNAAVWRATRPNEYVLWEASQRGMLSRDWDEDRRQVTINARAEASAPAYTASLDAALTLVPEGCDWTVDNFDGPHNRRCSSWINGDDTAHAVSPALALCSAALRALAQGATKP